MESFIHKLPKVELHAHLNGSISQETIQKLITKKKQKHTTWDRDKTYINLDESKNYTDIFDMFKLIYLLTDDEDAVYTITCDVIKEFAEDNVKYLELRTTPRGNTSSEMTKSTYIEAVLKGIHDCRVSQPDIIVKLILCINRKDTIDESFENLKLAITYREQSPGIIVGIDLCGFPHAGDARNFIPVFKEAQKNGFKLTLHLSETENQEDETKKILEEVKPDRIGHGVFIQHKDYGGSVQIMRIMEQLMIPIEICLTSNVKAEVVSSYNAHHFKYWYNKGHPISICTDDKGVFSTSLSNEYLLAANTFNLTQGQVWDLSYNSIDYIFGEDELKQTLKVQWESMKNIV